ncbi:MAG: 4Fe-4S dicluster domain-containing protein [Candidatus Heimdallarchaeota archaeon]
MIRMIVVDISKCTGCRRCETACSFYHSGKVSNRSSRIKVLSIYETGLDAPVVCQQCKERYCLKCPVDAISIGDFGQIIVSPTICTLCGACERNCPIGAIELFNGIIYVCDLCGGEPKCVEACTENALSFKRDNERPSLEGFKRNSLKKTPSEKRFLFIQTLGTKLRKQWGKKDV